MLTASIGVAGTASAKSTSTPMRSSIWLDVLAGGSEPADMISPQMVQPGGTHGHSDAGACARDCSRNVIAPDCRRPAAARHWQTHH